MTITRLSDRCLQCGGPVYTVAEMARRGKCAHCGAGYLVTPREPLAWPLRALQAAITLFASAAIVGFALLGAALEPQSMLYVGVVLLALGAVAAIWFMVGELLRHD